MKRLAVLLLALLPFASPSIADDFSGFYAGAEGGYGQNDARISFGAYDLGDLTNHAHGYLGGAYAGYGSHFGWFYYGAEGNMDLARISGTGTAPPDTLGPSNTQLGLVTTYNWLASLRARLGFLAGNVLLYGTAGYGWGGGSFEVEYGTTPTTVLTQTAKSTLGGFVWGGGVEFPVLGNWLGRVQYLQYDLGSNAMLGFAQRNLVQTVQIGLGYKF